MQQATCFKPQGQVHVNWNNYFYLGTPLTRYEYLRISINLIPDEIFQKYNLLPLVIYGFIYLDIHKVIYELTQTGRPEN